MTQRVTLYTSPGCTLCRYAREDLELLAGEQALVVTEVDVTTDERLAARYLLQTPVVAIVGGPELTPPITLMQLRRALAAAEE